MSCFLVFYSFSRCNAPGSRGGSDQGLAGAGDTIAALTSILRDKVFATVNPIRDMFFVSSDIVCISSRAGLFDRVRCHQFDVFDAAAAASADVPNAKGPDGLLHDADIELNAESHKCARW